MKFKISMVFLVLFAVLTVVTIGCLKKNNPVSTVLTATPTITHTITNTPTRTSTATVTSTLTSTPTATGTATCMITITPICGNQANAIFEDFEAGWAWGPVGQTPTNVGWAMSSVTGWNGTTANFQQSATHYAGSDSMQFDARITSANGYGFFGFYSSYASAFGGPINVEVGGAAPNYLSCWVYSGQATNIYFGLWDGASTPHSSYTNAFSPGNTAVSTASTWTQVGVPINAGSGGAPWDANITSIDFTKITYVLIGPTDNTASGITFTVNIDDVYFY